MSISDPRGITPARDDAAGFTEALRNETARLSRTLVLNARRMRDPADAEAVHDVRVAARRLEAALRLWREHFLPDPWRRLVRQVRRIRRRLGGARELEVHAELLRGCVGDEPSSAKLAAEPLLARWTRRALRARRRAAGRITPRRVRRLRERIGRAILPTPALPDHYAGARAQLEQRRQRATDAVQGALAEPGEALFHRARIAVKKHRYAVESFGALTGSEPHSLRVLREMQQALGDLHDAALLEERLRARQTRLMGRGLHANAAALGPLRSTAMRMRQDAETRVRQLVRWSPAATPLPRPRP